MLATLKNNVATPYDYVIEMALTSLQANAVGSVTFSADCWFELHQIRGISTGTNADQQISPNFFKVAIVDNGTGKSLSNGQVHQRNLCASGQYGPWEPRAILFAPNTVIQATFTSLYAGSQTVDLILSGFKLFNVS